MAHLPEIAEIRLRLDEDVAGWVATHGEMLTVGRNQSDPRFSDRIDAMTDYRTHSLLAAPVRAPGGGEGVMAVLQILNKRDGDFTSADRELAARMFALAARDGAKHIYVSSSETAHTVDFYRSLGFELTRDPHPELFALEPLDIHMVRPIDSA